MADIKEKSDSLFGKSNLLALAVELEVTGRMQSALMIGQGNRIWVTPPLSL